MLYEVFVIDENDNEVRSDYVEAASCEEALEKAAQLARDEVKPCKIL